jgi:hypothetical protein
VSLKFDLPYGGDVSPADAAAHMGMSFEKFNADLPELLLCGFPAPDITTGNYSIEAMDAWRVLYPKSVHGRLRAAGFKTKPDLEGRGFVYFISGGGLIKIGRAFNPFSRLKDLQLGSPVKLTLGCAVPGGADLEGTLHQFFAAERQHGEWFHPSGRLTVYRARAIDLGFAPDVGFSEAGAPIV